MSPLTAGDGFTLDAGPFDGVFDTPDPGAKGRRRLFDAMNMTIGDPEHGSAIVARHGFNANQTTLGSGANHTGQCVFLHRRSDSTLDRFVFVGGRMYRWDGTLGPAAFTDITPTNVAIHPTNPIFCLGYNDQLVVTDEQNTPWVYDVAAATAALILHNGLPSTFATRGGFTNYANKIFCIVRNSLNSLYFLALPVSLARGSTDTQLAIGAYSYRQGRTGGFTSNSAINPQALGALGTIPANTWGIIAIEGNAVVPIYTFTSGAANYTSGYASEAEAIAALPLPLAGAVRVGYFTVRSSGSVWRAGLDALAGGATGNPATFTNYYPGQYPDVSGQNTIMWSEELTPLVGYVQPGLDDSWTLTQTSDEVLAVLDGEEGLLAYIRNTGIGSITGAVTTDFKSSATRDSISTSTGSDAPAATASINKRIWSVDLDGLPYRVVGGVVQMLNLPLRRAADEQSGTVRTRPNVASFARIGHHERYNMVLYTIWDATTIYAFDEPTGNYVGIWGLGTAAGVSAPVNASIDAMGPMVDNFGRSTFMILGGTARPATLQSQGGVLNQSTTVSHNRSTGDEVAVGQTFRPSALSPYLDTISFFVLGSSDDCNVTAQVAEWDPITPAIGTIVYTSSPLLIAAGGAFTERVFSASTTLDPAKTYIAFLNPGTTPVPVVNPNVDAVSIQLEATVPATWGNRVLMSKAAGDIATSPICTVLAGQLQFNFVFHPDAVAAIPHGIAWTEKHTDNDNQWIDQTNPSGVATLFPLTRAIESQWLTKSAVTAYRATDVAAQLVADVARHAVLLQYVTPSAGLSAGVTAQSTATTGEKSALDSISVARWSTGPNAQGTAIRFRLSATHVDNVRWGVQTLTIQGVVTQARGDQK